MSESHQNPHRSSDKTMFCTKLTEFLSFSVQKTEFPTQVQSPDQKSNTPDKTNNLNDQTTPCPVTKLPHHPQLRYGLRDNQQNAHDNNSLSKPSVQASNICILSRSTNNLMMENCCKTSGKSFVSLIAVAIHNPSPWFIRHLIIDNLWSRSPRAAHQPVLIDSSSAVTTRQMDFVALFICWIETFDVAFSALSQCTHK